MRKKLKDKRKRESEYRKKIIEGEQSRKKGLSTIPESEEKTGGKNRKTKRKTRKVRKLKKRGGVAPPKAFSRRNQTSSQIRRIPVAPYLQPELDRTYEPESYYLYIGTAYDAITNIGNLQTINDEEIERVNGETIERVNAFDYITNSIFERFRERIQHGNVGEIGMIHSLLERGTNIAGDNAVEVTLDELRSSNPGLAERYRNFINSIRRLLNLPDL